MSHIFKSLTTQHSKAMAVLTIAAMNSNAFALGGLEKAQSAADDVKTGLFAVVGVVALIYMTYLGVMAFTEKKSWSDFGWGIVHVGAVGGSVQLGSWGWTLFTA